MYHKGGRCSNPHQVLRGSCLLFEILAFSSVQTFGLSLRCPWEVTAPGLLVISLSPGQDPTHQASCGTAMHIPCPVLLSRAHGPGPRGGQAQAPHPRTDPQGRGDSPAGVLFMVTVQTPVRGNSEEFQATGLRSDWLCQRLESTGQARIGSPCGRCPESCVCK